MTSTLVGLAFDSAFGGGSSGHPWMRRASAILLLGIGAVAGGLLLKVGMGVAILLAAAVTAAVAIVGELGRRAAERA